MNIFLPTNISRLLTMTVLCAVYAAIQAFAFSWLVSFSYFTLFLDAFLDAIFLAVLSVLLNRAIVFGNYVTLGIYQRLINYIALGLLTLGVWIGLSLLSSYLVFGNENSKELWSMIPIKVFIGMLVYILIVQFIHYRIEYDEPEEEEDVISIDKNNAEEVTEILDRVVVKIGQKIHVINVSDIIYIQSDGDYVQIFTQENHFLKEETMKYFEIHLPSAIFVRIHRSYIVNVEKILRIELYEKKNQILTLTNGHKIKASASGYKLLREALNQ